MYPVDKTCNAVFSLHYHFVTVVKYRQKVFEGEEIVGDVKEIMIKIASDFDVEVVEIGVGEDHVHMVFRAKPTLDVTKFINILKGHSSRELRKKYKEYLKDKLWGDNFWSPSYFLATTGNVTIDVLKEYVENQRGLQDV